MSFIETQIQAHESNFQPEKDPEDLIEACLREAHLKETSVGRENVKKMIADILFASIDSIGSLGVFVILYMIHYPDVQRRCQREIDQWFPHVVEERCQLTKDFIVESLPYTTASFLEIMRVAPPAPSLPHFSQEDLTIAGYHVPKGTMIVGNIRFAHKDPEIWERPDDFDPNRWLNLATADGRPELIHHSSFMPFGVGERRCVGENVAKVGYLIFGVSLLKKFRFEAENRKKLPSLVGQGPVFYNPQSFDVAIKLRH